MMREIEIDFDIHRMIENERKGFDEPEYLALRRLLKLPKLQETKPSVSGSAAGRPWREDGVEIPHGAEARMSYQRGSQVFEGQFLDGKLVVDGKAFDTLSGAASALARTRYGTVPNLNGWNYWEVKIPGRPDWLPMKLLRRRQREARL